MDFGLAVHEPSSIPVLDVFVALWDCISSSDNFHAFPAVDIGWQRDRLLSQHFDNFHATTCNFVPLMYMGLSSEMDRK